MGLIIMVLMGSSSDDGWDVCVRCWRVGWGGDWTTFDTLFHFFLFTLKTFVSSFLLFLNWREREAF